MPKSKEQLVQDMHIAKLFDEPIVEEYFVTAEQKLFDAWRKTKPEDTKRREEIFIECLGVQAFRDHVKKVKVTGTNAQRDLQKKYDDEMAAINKNR